MTTIKNVTEGEEKLKSLTGFLSANKINNYNRAGDKGGGKWGKKSKRIYRTSKKIRIIKRFS